MTGGNTLAQLKKTWQGTAEFVIRQNCLGGLFFLSCF
jgi:hypothetical protein